MTDKTNQEFYDFEGNFLGRREIKKCGSNRNELHLGGRMFALETFWLIEDKWVAIYKENRINVHVVEEKSKPDTGSENGNSGFVKDVTTNQSLG